MTEQATKTIPTGGKPFDYVAYDQEATAVQNEFKRTFESILQETDLRLKSPRAKALVKTKLEEAYMWVGKAIRDDQVARNGSAPLEEGRSNS